MRQAAVAGDQHGFVVSADREKVGAGGKSPEYLCAMRPSVDQIADGEQPVLPSREANGREQCIQHRHLAVEIADDEVTAA